MAMGLLIKTAIYNLLNTLKKKKQFFVALVILGCR